MPQSSAPIVGVNLSDADWRDAFGDEAGVLGDLDGSAYKLTLPTDSDTLTVGSTSQRSMARVAGFIHRIPAGETETLAVPEASGSARTDIVALRYDPANTGAPGPVQLARVAGTSVGIPSYDDAAPGVEDLPLWAVTRQPGQGLSQATVRDLRARLAPALDLPAGAPLPLSSPLGTTVRQGGAEYRRELGTSGVPVWVPATRGTQDFSNNTLNAGWGGNSLAWQGTTYAWVPNLGAKVTIPAADYARTVKLISTANTAGDIWMRIRADISGQATQHFPSSAGRRSVVQALAEQSLVNMGRFVLPAGRTATVFLEARAQAQGSGAIFAPQLDITAF